MNPAAPVASEAPVLVLGTDTAVGKTTACRGLLRLSARRGPALVPFKPAESGTSPGEPGDAERLRDASRLLDLPLELIRPYAFEPPVAPAVAAAAAGQAIQLDRVLACARALSHHGRLLVEAAGGVLTPYGPGLDALDIGLHLGASALLVARNSLGTINHTALAYAELRRRGLRPLGVLLVNTTPALGPDAETNADWIVRLTGASVFGPVPNLPAASDDALADALAATGVAERIFSQPRA